VRRPRRKRERIVVADLKRPPDAASYSGHSTLALGFGIEAETPAIANERIQAFGDDLVKLLERHPAVKLVPNGVSKVIVLEQQLANERAFVERMAAQQARDN
jgi:hypothetical protein